MARQTGCNVIPFPGQETTLIKNTKAITTDKSGINSIHNPVWRAILRAPPCLV